MVQRARFVPQGNCVQRFLTVNISLRHFYPERYGSQLSFHKKRKKEFCVFIPPKRKERKKAVLLLSTKKREKEVRRVVVLPACSVSMTDLETNIETVETDDRFQT